MNPMLVIQNHTRNKEMKDKSMHHKKAEKHMEKAAHHHEKAHEAMKKAGMHDMKKIKKSKSGDCK